MFSSVEKYINQFYFNFRSRRLSCSLLFILYTIEVLHNSFRLVGEDKKNFKKVCKKKENLKVNIARITKNYKLNRMQ